MQVLGQLDCPIDVAKPWIKHKKVTVICQTIDAYQISWLTVLEYTKIHEQPKKCMYNYMYCM